jgi:anti-sigma B factor antagonist
MENISIRISESPLNKEITLLTVKGSMDSATAPEFDRIFQSALRERKFRLVIDLTEVDYISSAGWGVFVGEIKRIRNEKGDLVLAGMNPGVMEVFNLLDFNAFLKFFPDVETAVQKGFGTKAPFTKPGHDKGRAAGNKENRVFK